MKSLALLFASGLVFGLGLELSGMHRQEVVLSFLQFDDLGLAVMMGTALLVATPLFQWALRKGSRPWCAASYERMPAEVRSSNVFGGILFGIGWGLSGVCPGSAIASLGAGNLPILWAFGGMLLGAYVQGRTSKAS